MRTSSIRLKPESLTQTLRRLWRENQWVYLLVGIAIGLLIHPLLGRLQLNQYLDFLNDLVPEAVGIIFTVLILDRLDNLREKRQVRDQLIRRVHSRYNHTALQAIEEMRVLGYLEDNTLASTQLRGSDWQDANMYRANLSDTDLRNAKLSGADFVEANLSNAMVTDEQLANALTMYAATMPDGSRYNGRFNLPGDFDYARRSKVNINSEEAMANWYGVTLEDYQAGQRWAEEELPRLRKGSDSE